MPREWTEANYNVILSWLPPWLRLYEGQNVGAIVRYLNQHPNLPLTVEVLELICNNSSDLLPNPYYAASDPSKLRFGEIPKPQSNSPADALVQGLNNRAPEEPMPEPESRGTAAERLAQTGAPVDTGHLSAADREAARSHKGPMETVREEFVGQREKSRLAMVKAEAESISAYYPDGRIDPNLTKGLRGIFSTNKLTGEIDWDSTLAARRTAQDNISKSRSQQSQSESRSSQYIYDSTPKVKSTETCSLRSRF